MSESKPGTLAPAATDAALIRQIQDGDRGALAALYDRHGQRMLGLARRMLHSRNDAEDLLHDVFLEVWHRADGYDPQRGPVAHWLLLRLRSRALDRLRGTAAARARGLAEPLQEDLPAPPGDDPCSASESAETRAALQSLTPIQRDVIELMYFQGLSCSEIATRRQIPAGTVKSRLSSALARLRQTPSYEQDRTNER